MEEGISRWKEEDEDLDFPYGEKSFRGTFQEEISKFRGHAREAREHAQYEQLKQLKENLTANKAIVEMDFAKN